MGRDVTLTAIEIPDDSIELTWDVDDDFFDSFDTASNLKNMSLPDTSNKVDE